MRHTLILSDLHLWQATEPANTVDPGNPDYCESLANPDASDLWMRYRQRRFAPDAQIAALVARIYRQIGSEPLELVLNGDIFDFDVPPVIDGRPVPGPTPRTAQAARPRMAAILDDHEQFLDTLAMVLARGDRVVFISGNHDAQLSLREVRTCLVERLINRLRIRYPDCVDYRAHQRILFRCWYYQTLDGIHVEHGNQYDLYCSVVDPTSPLRRKARLLPNAGSLVMEHLIGHLGYFNPNVERSFLLTTREYLDHWRTFYQRSHRSLVGTWFRGSLRIVWQLGCTYGWRGPRRADRVPRSVRAAAGRVEREPSPRSQRAHAALFALPDVRAAMRLLCIDRLVLLLALLAGALLTALWLPLGIGLLLATLLVHFLLQPQGPTPDMSGVNTYIEDSARTIARIYRARAVVFGHTHQAFGRWEDGVFFGNSGTWAPMYHDVACRIPVEESRPLIWLRSDETRVTGGLYRFYEGRLIAEGEAGQQAVELSEDGAPRERKARSGSARSLELPPTRLRWLRPGAALRALGPLRRGRGRRAARGAAAIPAAAPSASPRAAGP
jgi:UDP-2,3-diacylglucosamine pyrophosphatase LpxH